MIKERQMHEKLYILQFSDVRPLKQILHCSKDSKRKRKYNLSLIVS